MPNPCLTTPPALSDPLLIDASPGTINLKVTGTVFLDPSQTDVVQTDGTKVSFTCTAQTLSFTAAAGQSYFLEIMHAGTMPTSIGNLQEDCTDATVLAVLSAANTFTRLKVVVSGAVAAQAKRGKQ